MSYETNVGIRIAGGDEQIAANVEAGFLFGEAQKFLKSGHFAPAWNVMTLIDQGNARFDGCSTEIRAHLAGFESKVASLAFLQRGKEDLALLHLDKYVDSIRPTYSDNRDAERKRPTAIQELSQDIDGSIVESFWSAAKESIKTNPVLALSFFNATAKYLADQRGTECGRRIQGVKQLCRQTL